MGISKDRVKPITSPLYGFTSASAPVKGIASLTVVVGEVPQQATHTLDFLIVKVKSSYNGILGRTGLNRLQAVASTYHLLMKFPTPRGVGFVKGDQTLARRCYVASCRPEETLSIDDQRDETTARRTEPVEALIHVALEEGNDERQVQIADMPEIDPSVITHKLSVDPNYKPVKQKKWLFASERQLIIKKEVNKLLEADFIKEIDYPDAVLVREEVARKLPIYYVSKVLQGAEQRYPDTEKLAFALLMAARKLRPYFQSHTIMGLWVDELPKILWAYNTTTRTPTSETPFSLSFETEALIPIKIGLPSLHLTTYDPIQNAEALRANLDLLDERRKQAAMRLAAYQHRVSKFYDQRVRPRMFRVGDLVLRRIEAFAPRDAIGKLAPNWEGPYKP
ncbi:hypothetical protein RJ639_034559 [Escallonia herrerae]|uniref:Reverse transcriptase RNase H-like domain-containing protein n=1 Tax=Escallonia herrerae TaxID=1293975 RepID=A0AA88X7S5_9ASTE|nr:hypothetical protein RJ639_034559 [Escallonia herrerae]